MITGSTVMSFFTVITATDEKYIRFKNKILQGYS